MKDALRLINRHGGKIWLVASLGEAFLACLWIVGLVAAWFIVNPSSETIHKVFTAIYFPDHPEKLSDQIRTEILDASPKAIALLVTMAAFFGCSILFSVTGMMGLIRQAAVEDRLSIRDFFAYGFRYLFRMSGLILIQSGAVLLLGWIFLRLFSLADPGSVLRVALWGAGGITGVYALTFFSFTPVVMLVEESGIFRTFGRVFRLFWAWPLRTISTLLTAAMSAVLGLVLLGLIAAFPWLILQFFQNEIIAGMVGSFFGLLMIFTFHAFPVTLYMGTMIIAYVEMRERLFPKEIHREGNSLPPHNRVIWSRV